MVLSCKRRLGLLIALASGALATPGAALAQQIDRTAPILDLPDNGLGPVGIQAGSILLLPSGEAGVTYDSNIYAAPSNRVDDLIAIVTPRMEARLDRDDLSLSLLGEATLRRFFKRSSENSTAALVDLKSSFKTGESDRFSTDIGWRRAIEDRGDPEARDNMTLGPRRIDILNVDGGWQHDARLMHLAVSANTSRIDYVSPLDSDRDLVIYGGQASVARDVSATVSAVITAFATRRNFRLARDFANIDRDATTYGARAGLRLADTGLIRGDASVGVFRFNPDDPTLPSRTGLSIEASVAYLPTRRVAFTLDAFRGDVATVRNGAQARTDTRVRVGVQAEARANLRLQASVFYRNSDFIGSGVSERTVGATAEAEYRLNRFLSVAATAIYAHRTSDDPTAPFERARFGIELRAQY